MKHSLAIAGMLAMPCVVSAEDLAGTTLTCSFTTECYELEECTFAEFAVDVALPDTFPGTGSLLPDTGPAEGTADMLGDLFILSARDANGAYLLSRSTGGLAKLSVHYSGNHMMIAYDGQCRVAQ
ncbi:hypothetical protein J7443_05270 [Tropicibacter sp. R15_0]|uniref:hypothetical protein n=1 Tax=Tropicibacter sp. R15_0 TaxID=2821101 RepID=UPI001AD96226|nr:hypothetical protein [Tropicibacter sp. R15_0]MBO9464631.1 hypothetical protein [Tropicibacter sp. R15_0]